MSLRPKTPTIVSDDSEGSSKRIGISSISTAFFAGSYGSYFLGDSFLVNDSCSTVDFYNAAAGGGADERADGCGAG